MNSNRQKNATINAVRFDMPSRQSPRANIIFKTMNQPNLKKINVKNTIIGFGVLSMDASDLDVVLLSNLVELLLVVHELWQLDVDRGTHGGTQVGWARCDVAEVVVVGELQVLFNLRSSSLQSAENSLDISSWLHRDNSELVLLVDPDEEGLGGVVEDASARWPISVQISSS